MVSKRWKRSNTSVYDISYHLICCPKYPKKVLVDEIETTLKELLYLKASKIRFTIKKLEIILDHIHLFVKADPTTSPHWIVQQLKGYTSRVLRLKYSKLKSRLSTLWTRSYYCESIGLISEETIQKYIQDQKNM